MNDIRYFDEMTEDEQEQILEYVEYVIYKNIENDKKEIIEKNLIFDELDYLQKKLDEIFIKENIKNSRTI